MDIENAGQLRTHPLRGALFENAVVVEALKHSYNSGRRPLVSFFRDRRGLECGLLYRTGDRMLAVEAKSGATIASDWFSSLNRVAEIVPEIEERAVVHGGVAHEHRRVGEAVPLTRISDLLTRFDSGE